jgi:acylphosphatase
MTVCMRCLVAGRVQGVFFRASTHDKGQSLGVEVHAKNLPDGRVEVWVRGDEDKVNALRAWLWEGPSHARVEAVECLPTDEDAFDKAGLW